MRKLHVLKIGGHCIGFKDKKAVSKIAALMTFGTALNLEYPKIGYDYKFVEIGGQDFTVQEGQAMTREEFEKFSIETAETTKKKDDEVHIEDIPF